MISILFWSGVLIASLIVLIKSSDYFISASEKIGVLIRLPPFIIGVTLVAVGTSLPELASSLFAVFRGAPEIVIGNVIGSNVVNIFLILGITAIFAKKIEILHKLIHVDLPLLIGSAFLFAAFIWDGAISLFEAILLVCGLIFYIGYTISLRESRADVKTKKKIRKDLPTVARDRVSVMPFVVFVVSGLLIFLSARYVIDSVVAISEFLGVGAELIAVTIVALGTSLPELVVSIDAVRKKKAEIAVGNLLGSSIFNVFAVVGIPGLFGSLYVTGTVLTFGLPMMLIATFMYFFIAQDNEITQWEGWLLLLFYVFFIGKLLGFA